MKPAFTEKDLKLFNKYINISTNYFEFGSGGSTFQVYKKNNIQKIYSVESSNDWINIIIKELKCKNYETNGNYTKRLNFFDINFETKIGHLGLPIFKINDNINFLLSVENTSINGINIIDDKLVNGKILQIKNKSPYDNLIRYENKEKWIHPKLIRTLDNNITNNFNKYSDTIIKLHENTAPKLDLILIDGRFRVMCALKSYKVIDDNCVVLIDDFLNRKSYHLLLDYYDIIEKGDRMVALKKKENIKISDDLLKKYENDVR
jgi:hypothetical protein